MSDDLDFALEEPTQNELELTKRMQDTSAAEGVDSQDLAFALADPVADDEDDFLSQVLDVPVQVLAGFRNAADSAKNLAIEFATLPLTSGLPKEGPITREAVVEGAKEATTLPDLPEPKSTAGALTEGISQFLGPFALLGKTERARKTKELVGTTTEAALRGAKTDLIAFDEHTKRLSELAKEHGFESDLTDWLADRTDDSAFEARVKNTLEGAALGGVVDAVVKGAKYIKGGLNAKKVAKQAVTDSAPLKEQLKGTAKQATELAGDGRRTKFDFDAEFRPDKETIAIEAQRREAQALGVTIDDLKSGNVKGLALGDKRRTVLNAITEAEVVAHGQFMDTTKAYATRLNAGDKAATDEWVRDVFSEMMTISGKAKDAFSEDARALGFRGHQKEISNINKLIDIMQSASPKKVNKLITAMSELDDPAEVEAFLKQMIDDPASVAKPTFMQKIETYYLNSILSSPVTLAVDTIGSVIFTPYTALEKIPAGIIGKYRKWGNIDDSVQAMEGVIALRNYASSTMDGLSILKRDGVRGLAKAIKDVKVDNLNKFGPELDQKLLTVPEGMDPKSWKGQMITGLDAYLRHPSIFMKGKDDIVKAMIYRSSVEEHAVRQAMNEGLSGQALQDRIRELMVSPISNVADNMKRLSGEATAEFAQATKTMGADAGLALDIQRKAIAAAREATFTKEASPLAAGAKSVIDSIPGGKFIVPFIKTVDNISREGLKRTPLTLINPSWYRTVKAGGPQADLALARFGMGSGITITSFLMAQGGMITGEGPKDSATRDKLLQRGWRPRSIAIDGKYIEYGRLAPLAIPMMISANMAEMVNEHEDVPAEVEKDIADYMALGAQTIAQTLLSQSFATGIANVFKAIDKGDEAGLELAIQNTVAALAIPNNVNFVAQHINPSLQELDSTWERIQARMGQDVRPKRDVFGDPIMRDEYAGWFLPMKVNDATKTPKWKQTLFEDGALPNKPPKSVSVKLGKNTIASGIQITKAQHEELLDFIQDVPGSDKSLSEVMESVVSSPLYQNLPTVSKVPGSGLGKRELINQLYREAKNIATAKLVAKYPELKQRAIQKARKELTTPDLTKNEAVTSKYLKRALEE